MILAMAAGVAVAYVAMALAMYWGPLIALQRRRISPPSENSLPAESPNRWRFAVVAACRDGADCLPGFVDTFRAQDYPAEAVRLFLIADHCTDTSAELGRALGMDVYERPSTLPPGKGPAIREWMERRLRREAFDALIVLDMDCRVESDFLSRAEQHFRQGAWALACATAAKNAGASLLADVGGLIQRLLRMHQNGRAALGLGAVFHGSHGYALSRAALERLDWRTNTGLIAEDMEARLRCTLAGIPVRYADDLVVYNDVTARPAAVREQRRRWNSTYLPIIPRYAGPLLRQGCRGDRGAWDALFGLLLLPAFANLFLCATGIALALAMLSRRHAALRGFAAAAMLLWVLDVFYFIEAFAVLHVRLGPREIQGFAWHLALRALALAESPFYVHAKDWSPAPHERDP